MNSALIVNNTISTIKEEPPGYANSPNPNKTTAYLDCGASITCLGKEAACIIATIQEQNIALGAPRNIPIMTTKMLELLLKKLPTKARRAFLVPEIPHNLVAAAKLVNAGCSIYLHKTGFEIGF